jgi:hypothetical protein
MVEETDGAHGMSGLATWQATSVSGGAWNDATHWSTAAVPGPATNVDIPSVAATPWAVTVPAATAAVALNLELVAPSGTLVDDGSLSLVGNFALGTGASVAAPGNGTLVVGPGGALNVAGNLIATQGTIVVNGGTITTMSFSDLDGVNATLQGGARWTSSIFYVGQFYRTDVVLQQAAVVTAALVIGMDQTTAPGVGIGTLDVTGGSEVAAASLQIVNTSTLSVDSLSAVVIGSAASVAGAVAVGVGSTASLEAATLQGNLALAGTLDVAENPAAVSPGTGADITGALTGGGSVLIGSGYSLEVGSASGFSGTISMVGGTLDLSGLAFGGGLTPTYNAATGFVTLGADTLSVGTGLPANAFSAVSDGHGGTDLVETPAGEVVLHGSHAEYVVADDSGSLYIQDNGSAGDGTQVLPGVTEMVFTDGIGIFDPTGAAEDVSRLYQAALARAPDVAGLEYWTAQINASNVSLATVANDFAASPEFIADYGSLTAAGFVDQLYENVLGRAADAAGAAYWENVLASGASEGAVMLDFAESPENEADTLSTAGDQNNAEAYRLYQAAFDRVPDATGEAYWSAVLANGATPLQVAQDFVSSAEFQQDYGTLSSSAFVSALYENALHRAADASGLSYWTGLLQQGTSQATVLLGFSDSLENRVDTATATHANWVFIPS